jgi:hypothetical protein
MKYGFFLVLLIGLVGSFQRVEQPKMSASAELITMRINGRLMDSTVTPPIQCFVVQKGASIGTDNWEQLCEEIDGFHFHEGYQFDISVRVELRSNPTENESRFHYQLIKILSKTKK